MKGFVYGLVLLLAPGVMNAQKKAAAPVYEYKPDSQELYDAIARMDSIFFEAYNTCKMDVQAAIYSDSIEFYHDKGGVSTSKKDILDATRRNICGKVTRQLIPGSIEVYPIKDYGAIELGQHKFFNNQEPDAPQHISRFMVFWKKTGNDWKIVKVVSLH
ncbi:MAG TPA: nuclear transport factor 2 family protein [Chitinophagaceae bacterium]|nr:nuclear transport factor 2 family protein [Chitinophagaceae bacterium]